MKQNDKGGRTNGEKDDYQYDYLDSYVRFADQVNGALFGGRQVVKPDELEPVDAMTVYLGKEAGARKNYKNITDKARTWRGRLIHIITIQNQTYVDYRMVIRNMLAESIGYHKQWRLKKAAHKEAKDLESGSDAFQSKINKNEKFTPIITLVVYCGTEHPWDGARCLYDLLDIDDEMKEFVTNYKLNLYDCHEHDTFDEYHSGLRQLFEVIRYGRDKEQLQRIMEENREHRCSGYRNSYGRGHSWCRDKGYRNSYIRGHSYCRIGCVCRTMARWTWICIGNNSLECYARGY